MEGKEQILELLQTLKGERVNICSEIYKVIKKNEAQSVQLLQFFCEQEEFTRSSEEEEARKVFTEGELIDYENDYGGIVDALLEKLLRKKLPKEDFYAELWKNITLENVFENEKAQCFALYYVLIDGRIPYFELPDTISIDKEEYRNIVDGLHVQEQKARFIMLSDFKGWSEVSYLLLQELDEVEDLKEKIVLLSTFFQTREKMLFSKLLEQIKKEKNSEVD